MKKSAYNFGLLFALLSSIVVLNTTIVLSDNITSAGTGNWSATAWPNTVRAGTITTSTADGNVVGVGTLFTTEISVGNIIKTTGNIAIGTVLSIADNTHLTLTGSAASTNSGIAYNSQGVGTGDAVTIASGHTVTVDNAGAQCASIVFTGGASANRITISDTYALTVSGAITINSPSGTNLTNSLAVLGGTLSVGSFSIVGGNGTRAAYVADSTGGTINCTGDISISGNTENASLLMGNGTLNLGGAFGTGGTFSSGTGTVNYNGSGAQIVIGLGYYNLTISGARTTNNVTLVSSGTIGIAGTFTNSATFTSGSFVNSNNTVDYNGTGAQTVTAFNYNNLTISGVRTTNNVTLASSGTIGVAGSLTNTATFSGSNGFVTMNSTVNYNGTGAQSITALSPSFTGNNNYNNLTISNTASEISAGTSFAVGGNFTVNSGAIVSPAAVAVISGGGTLTGNGTVQVTRIAAPAEFSSQYTITNKTLTNLAIEYVGGVAQALSALTYGGLKINNSSGVTLSSGNATVNGVLTLTRGTITTGTNRLSVGSTGSVSRSAGYIIGNLQRAIPAGASSVTFDLGDASNYTPTTVAFASGTTAGNLTATVSPNTHPNLSSSTLSQTKYVNRYWSFTNGGVGTTTYNATFNFVTGDIQGSGDPNKFVVGKYNSGWTYPTVGARTSTSTQATGLSSFSDFVIAEGVPNIAVSSSMVAFTSVAGTPSVEQTYTLSGAHLTDNITVTPPTDFELSLTSGSGFVTSPLTLTQTGGTVAATTIYVRINRATAGSPSGNITHTSTGATQQNVPVSGTVAAPPLLYVSNSQNVAAAAVIYPDNSWNMPATYPTGYLATPPDRVVNDWGYTTTQQFAFSLVPSSGMQFSNCSVTLQFDANTLAYVSTEFGTSDPNGLLGTGHAYATTRSASYSPGSNQVVIGGSRDDGNNFTTVSGDYIAKVNFTLKNPGYSAITVVAQDFKLAGSSTAFLVVPYEAKLRAYLGDVAQYDMSPPATLNESTGDGKVNFGDLTTWAPSYWSGTAGYGMDHYKIKYDIGPTYDNGIYSLPAQSVGGGIGPDGKVDFEDLMIFSMVYGLSNSGSGLPKVPTPSKDPIAVSLGQPSVAGSEMRIPVMVAGGITDIRGMKIEVSGQFAQFLGAEKGELVSNYSTPVMVMSRADEGHAYVDFAVLGLDAHAVSRAGELVVLRFKGTPYVRLTGSEARNSINTPLKIEKVKGAGELAPSAYQLSQNYPNPFNPSTHIRFEIPGTIGQGLGSSSVKLVIYDLLGREVAVLANEQKPAGTYELQFDASGLASGVYVYRMTAGSFTAVRKMVLTR